MVILRWLISPVSVYEAESFLKYISPRDAQKDSVKFKEGDTITLSCEGENFALLKVADRFGWDKEVYNQNIYKTLDKDHPGVQKTDEMNPVLVGGEIELFKETPGVFPQYQTQA